MQIVDDISRLINQRRYDEATLRITKLDNRHLQKILQSMIAASQGDFDEQEILCEEVLQDDDASEISTIWALDGKAWSNIRKGNYDQALAYLEKAETILQTYFVKISSMEPLIQASLLNTRGSLNLETGNTDRAIEQLTNSLAMYEEQDVDYKIASTQNNLAFAYQKIGDLNTSLNLFNKSLKYYEQFECKQPMCRVKSNIAEIHRYRSEFDTALQYHLDVLEIRTRSENNYDIALSSYYVGSVYLELGSFIDAELYLTKSVELWKKIGNKQWLSAAYLALGKAYLEMEDDVIPILEEIEKDLSQSSNRLIIQRYYLLRSYYLKNQNRIAPIAEAQELLENIIFGEMQDFELLYEALLLYCELLFIELRITSNHEVYKEAKDHINRLERLTDEQSAFGKKIEVMFLRAKMAIVDMNYEEAEKILTQTEFIAEERDMRYYHQFIEKVRELLESDMQTIKNIIDQNQDILERVKIMELSDYLKKATEIKRNLNPPD